MGYEADSVSRVLMVRSVLTRRTSGSRAVDTWIHFLYWIKAFFLFLAVVQNRWAPWRVAAARRRQTSPQPQGVGYMEQIFESCMGATASCELATWVLISVFAHALLSAIILLLVLVLRHEFQSNTQWILSVVFDAVAIVESILSPLVVTRFGVGETDTALLYDEADMPRRKRVRFAGAQQQQQQQRPQFLPQPHPIWLLKTTGRGRRTSVVPTAPLSKEYGL